MRRVYFYGIWADGCRFIGKHRLRFILSFLAAGVFCLFGLWRAFADTRIGYASIEGYNIVLLIVGERAFFSYWLFQFLQSLLLIVVILLFSVHPIGARLSILPILLYAFFCAHCLCALFIVAELSVLLLSLVCLIPCFILTLFILLYLSIALACTAASRPGFYRVSEFLLEIKNPFLFAMLACFIMSLIETILACIFSIGIIL